MEHWILQNERCRFCGKVTYETRDDAMYASRSWTQVVTTYECKYGTGWHLSRKVLEGWPSGKALVLKTSESQ